MFINIFDFCMLQIPEPILDILFNHVLQIKNKTRDKYIARVSDMYPYPIPNYQPLKRGITEEDRGFALEKLKALGSNTGAEFLLSPEPEITILSIPSFEDIIFTADYANSVNKANSILEVR